jgi:hypothetical protein
VLAWGEDTYQSAPDDAKRFTQCLHQAAFRLQNISESQIPRAATFRMLATDTIIDTTTGSAVPNIPHMSRDAITRVGFKKSQIIRARPQPMCRGQ